MNVRCFLADPASVLSCARSNGLWLLAAAPPPAPAVPKTRQITGWLLSRPASLNPGEQAQLAGIRARCPHIDSLAAHITSFAEMMTNRTGHQQLPGWLTAAV